MPARDVFGADTWDVFARSARADAYRLKADPNGRIVGPTSIASSSRADGQFMHRLWSFMQDERTFEPVTLIVGAPMPQFLVRYSRGLHQVDMAIDFDLGMLTMYRTGNAKNAKWISVLPVRDRMKQEFVYLFDLNLPPTPARGT